MTSRAGWILAAACAAGACAAERPAPDLPVGRLGVATATRTSPARATVPQRASLDRQGGSVALARFGDRTLAYVADADSHAVHTIDVGLARQVVSTKLQGSPSQLLVLSDGRVAVALSDVGAVAILEPGRSPEDALQLRTAVETSAEPVGLALTPDDATLLVTSASDAELLAFDALSLEQRFAVSLPRDPRAVLVDRSGQRAFVSHAVGATISVVDLSQQHGVRSIPMTLGKASTKTRDQRLRGGGQGYALASAVISGPPGPGTTDGSKSTTGGAPAPLPTTERIFAPMVTVDPGEPEVPSQAYYGPNPETVPRAAPMVGVVDAASERSLAKTKIAAAHAQRPCLLPRAAAMRSSTQTMFVACAGIDALLELDTRSSDPSRFERRRFGVPPGPTGVAIDDASALAVVWSQFEGVATIIDLRDDRAPLRVATAVDVSYEPKHTVETRMGREIFFKTADARIAIDGVGCATCHPDGRDDGLTWATPDGPRQTPMLAGRMRETGPYGWKGKHGDLDSYVKNTISRLGGGGLDRASGAALLSYLERVPGPGASRPHAGSALAERSARRERGREIFFHKQRCASCHVGGTGTDKASHDVASRVLAGDSPGFDTPSLQFVRGTAPYFHDGRYPTLDELLTKDQKMGHAALLSRDDREALAAYLESL